ncbi:monosaccharide ABC transporter membrane protein, CUT2 family [Faunimonas pinastri]|uniref:Monosaccharide ABC transporter membrane protein, CUT2 family n=1 Tax=Faunimonas pinastri TaxID=1855383 RepID=A0A1H9EKQ0_9HYPH|nr:ABC transporter permease [Faunimonas pinastri]SEQ26336.1 monosaccharide ABC transporter membrane protein, CUT2 family [Faunimonas pinastri]
MPDQTNIVSVVAEPAAPARTPARRSAMSYAIGWSNILVLILLLVIATILSPHFLSVRNLLNVLRGSSMVGIVSIGMTFVILNRGIDLSVGSIVGVSAALMAGFASDTPVAWILLPLVAGVVLGAVNGWMITGLRLQPFIATLGMMIFARGLVYIYTNGSTIVPEDPTDAFSFLGSGYIGMIPTPVILFALVAIGAALVLGRTIFGREVYAVGANEEAARLAGIRVQRNRVLVYVISGLLAAIAGIVLTSRLSVADPNGGNLFELDAIAAVLIGGTTFDGGRGGVGGTIIGVLILAFLSNLLNLMGVSPYSQMLLKGVIIVAAVVVSELRNR